MGKDERGESKATLGSLLGPHLAPLEAAARERDALAEAEAKAAAQAPRTLDEGQLMALIFAHLDDDNPRVCEGIDFERLVIIERAAAEPEDPPEPAIEAAHVEQGEARASADPGLSPTPTIEGRAWVGASWSDDLGPRVELVERPTPSAAERALVERANRVRGLAELDLHELDRHEALRHLEFFVQLCRASGQRFCRVITGKGVSSSGAPVLKRVVLEWCVAEPPRPSGRAQVSAWAPELDQYGEWGALILRLRA